MLAATSSAGSRSAEALVPAHARPPVDHRNEPAAEIPPAAASLLAGAVGNARARASAQMTFGAGSTPRARAGTLPRGAADTATRRPPPGALASERNASDRVEVL